MRRSGPLALGIVSADVLAAGGGAVTLLQTGWRDGEIGANARRSIHGLADRLVQGLAIRLGGQAVVLA